jgi:putative DNA primase/helicase
MTDQAGCDNLMCTDLGNAERLVAWHGTDLRHVPAWGWLVWNGRYWTRNDKLARERAHQTARQIYRSAGDHPDEATRKRLAVWAHQSEASTRLTAMLREAESSPKIRAEVADFDQNPMLLNVQNGTLNLATGELQAHHRENLLTKIVWLDYEAGTVSELWEKFLADATAGKNGLADFLRRAAGYTLTGSTREDAVLVAHGPGGSGKTTFVETLKAALGPYAGSIRIEVLTTSARSSGGHNEDIARLVGLRMVTAVEASEEERLREGQVKHMTGGDTIPASLKHKAAFDFIPVFKLWLATNEVPYIRSDDSGMWRRIHKAPFENPHEKTDLKDRLKDRKQLAGVLAWAVRGCLEWQRDGLRPPTSITEATDQLRRWMDGGFELFLTQCVLSDERDWTATRDIRATYTRWAQEMGIPEVRRISDQRLAAMLRRRGCEPEARRPLGPDTDLLRGWWGIKIVVNPRTTVTELTPLNSAVTAVTAVTASATFPHEESDIEKKWQNAVEPYNRNNEDDGRDILAALRARGLKVGLNGEGVPFIGPTHLVDEADRALLAAHREPVVAALQQEAT